MRSSQYEKMNQPSVKEISRLEYEAMQQLANVPRLPEFEEVANQIIKSIDFGTKVKAFFYALFWLFAVPVVLSIAVILAHFAIFSVDWGIAACWLAIVGGFLLFYGFFHNTQKRLFVAYCLGFRGVRNALVMGWDGTEYDPGYGSNDYYTKKYITKTLG